MVEHPAKPGESIGYQLVADLAAVRAFVTARALALGLSRDRADMLTLAVNELATNTLQYTQDGGEVQLWSESGQLYCDVLDQGPVLTFGGVMPAADAVRGRGLPIVELVCDHVAAFAVPRGSIVRLQVGI
ncbi:ATP-binding protein [Dactylosporangium sp. NPDC051541]|uniref:ATP-binding protein n=1 Tax=Dactylosporangium sp. NPDC051541 TaxID=3363977 RepID=UPI0037A9C628